MTSPRIVVVGAGIVGASIAYHLARRDAAITLVDMGQPAAGVTGKSFAWINVSHGVPESFFHLRHLAIQEYRRLDEDLDHALRVDWCGALTWTLDPDETAGFVREFAKWGYEIRLVERDQITVLEPNLMEPPDCAAFAASEGAIDPVAVTQALVHGARQAGADIRLDTEVIALRSKSSKVTGVFTRQGIIDADVVLLATGTGTGALCEQTGSVPPMESSPALLLRFVSTGKLINSVISNPEFEIRQGADGSLLAAEDFSDGSDPHAIAQHTLSLIKRRLRGADRLKLESATVGIRPIPADGCPIVGFSSQVDRLYFAVMHAGVTMAPAIGRFAATEILDGAEMAALEQCRPDRFRAGSSEGDS